MFIRLMVPPYLPGLDRSFKRQLKIHYYGSVIVSSEEFRYTRETIILKLPHPTLQDETP